MPSEAKTRTAHLPVHSQNYSSLRKRSYKKACRRATDAQQPVAYRGQQLTPLQVRRSGNCPPRPSGQRPSHVRSFRYDQDCDVQPVSDLNHCATVSEKQSPVTRLLQRCGSTTGSALPPAQGNCAASPARPLAGRLDSRSQCHAPLKSLTLVTATYGPVGGFVAIDSDHLLQTALDVSMHIEILASDLGQVWGRRFHRRRRVLVLNATSRILWPHSPPLALK